MRTKTMILGAAVLAAGLATSMAQSNVYSVNVVGYATVDVPPGFSMICNPLDFDGTGTNNTLNSAFGGTTNIPNLTQFFKFANGQFGSPSAYFNGSWFPNQSLNPGEGGFINNNSGVDTSVTFVGTVLQGNLSNVFPAGFSIVGSKVPQSGALDSTLGFTNGAANLDQVFTFNVGTQQYSSSSAYFNGAWFPSPQIGIGQAFFLNSAAGGTWTRSFTVQ